MRKKTIKKTNFVPSECILSRTDYWQGGGLSSLNLQPLKNTPTSWVSQQNWSYFGHECSFGFFWFGFTNHLNLVDWNVNELERKLELEDMKRTYMVSAKMGWGITSPAPAPRFLRPWAWVMISFPRILSSLCIIQFSILVFKFVCISSRRTHFLANVFDN